MVRKIVPDIINEQEVASMPGNTSIREVGRYMVDHGVGSILIMEDGELKGIFTERDVMTRVLDKGLDADTTAIGKVMTAAPRTVDPSLTILEALAIMAEGGYRHLPVVVDGDLVAIISIRDLYAAVTGGLEEDILALTSGVM